MTRRLLPTLLLALAAALGLLPAAGAGAAPSAGVAPADGAAPYPSADDIAGARAEADHRAAATDAIETLLDAARTERDQADRAAEQAVEAYNGAQVRLARARTEESAALQHAAVTELARHEAAEDAARLAAETYRQGAGAELSAIDALLVAPGPRAAGAQAAVIRVVGDRTRQILDAATGTAAAAVRASTAARQATEAAEQAAGTVRATQEQAQARTREREAQVVEIGRRREQLLADLAVARDTTADLERRRRDALEEVAAREAEAAARAAAERAETERAGREQATAGPVPGHPSPDPGPDPGRSSEQGAAAAIAFARSKIGLPYVWGGEGPRGYDCSGLTMAAWRTGGRTLPHFAADQYARSTPLTYRQLRPGDLVFWSASGRAADIFHVALYLGDDQMIEAPRAGRAIKQASLWIMGRPSFYARP